MSTDTIISVEGVSKKFCRSLKQTMLYGVKDIACDVLGFPQHSNGLRPDEFWALDNVSLEVKRGECVGVVGPNGAGKSTLLKLLNGITLPDKGSITIIGRVGALLELGAGFHPMLTGRENIRLSAAILGLGEMEIERKLDAIIDFAGLEEFIDSPVKYYSSGMYVRLGFAVASHADPDVFLIDEALAVGDALFHSKCFAKIREFRERGTTIIFVTHSLELVTSHCSRAILIEKGRLIGDGDPKNIVDSYNRVIVGGNAYDGSQTKQGEMQEKETSNLERTEWRGLFKLNPNEDRYGCKKAEILEAGIFSLRGDPVQVLECNREYLIKIKVRHNQVMPAAIVAYTIKNPHGVVLCGTNTLFQNIDMGWMSESETIVVRFKQSVRLNPGKFLLCVGIANYENGEYVVYDRRFDYLSFEVVGPRQSIGIFDANSVIEWERSSLDVDS